MRALKIAVPAILALAFLVALVAPIGPMPGLFIGGTSTKVPEQWGDTSNVDEIMLRVPGSLPRVVIIWVIEHGGELHVVGSRDSGWVKMIGAASPVEVRVGRQHLFVERFCGGARLAADLGSLRRKVSS